MYCARWSAGPAANAQDSAAAAAPNQAALTAAVGQKGVSVKAAHASSSLFRIEHQHSMELNMNGSVPAAHGRCYSWATIICTWQLRVQASLLFAVVAIMMFCIGSAMYCLGHTVFR
jgi:hypothetical protein